MRLSYYCKSCKKKNYIKSKAVDRFELQQEIGDEISPRCRHCGSIEKRHINRLNAEPEKYIGVLCLILALVLTTTIFYFGFIATLSLTFPIWLYFDAERKASQFNKIKVKRK